MALSSGADAESEQQRSLAVSDLDLLRRLERLPMTWVQGRLLMMGGLGYTFDAMDGQAVSFILSPVSKLFSLSDGQTGLLGSSVLIGYLFGATTIVGAIMCPLLMYFQDWLAGQTSTWSTNMVYKLAVMGFLLGSVVAVILYLAFKCLLQMGWLPSRR